MCNIFELYLLSKHNIWILYIVVMGTIEWLLPAHLIHMEEQPFVDMLKKERINLRIFLVCQ